MLTLLRHGADLLAQERRILGVRCFHADELLIDDDEVVHSAKYIHYCWIFFVNDVLAAMFELELVGLVSLQVEVDDAAYQSLYFSLQPLRELKVLIIGDSVDH